MEVVEDLMAVGFAVFATGDVNPVTAFGVVLKDELVEVGVVL